MMVVGTSQAANETLRMARRSAWRPAVTAGRLEKRSAVEMFRLPVWCWPSNKIAF